jgi:hypothetical protein
VAAAAVVAVVVAGFAAPVAKAIDDTRLVRSAVVQSLADATARRFECIRQAMTQVPDQPTYVAPASELPDVEWYQRAIELGFGEVPFVSRRRDAEQVLQLVAVPPGTGVCDDLDIRVRPL